METIKNMIDREPQEDEDLAEEEWKEQLIEAAINYWNVRNELR